MHLHSYRVSFDTMDGKKVRLEAPVPDYMRKTMSHFCIDFLPKDKK